MALPFSFRSKDEQMHWKQLFFTCFWEDSCLKLKSSLSAPPLQIQFGLKLCSEAQVQDIAS